MVQTLLVVGESRKAKAAAKMVQQHMDGLLTHVLTVDTYAKHAIQQAGTVVLIVPAKKEPYQRLKQLLSSIPKQSLNTKKIILVSTEGSVVHHGIIQMGLRAYSDTLLGSVHLPDEMMCVKLNGELVQNRKLMKKIALISEYASHIEKQVVS